MNTLKTTLRSSTLAVLMLGGTLAASAADRTLGGHVTVQAGRPTSKVVGRSEIGAPIELVELRASVSHSDLDLSIPSNAKVLKQRVHDAARLLCADLDRLYPVTTGNDSCAAGAEEKAMPQVDAAIAAAQARKKG